MGLAPFTSSTAQGHRSLPQAVVNDSSENRQTVCVGGFVGSAAVELPLGARSDFEPTREDEPRWAENRATVEVQPRGTNYDRFYASRWAGSPTRPRVRPTQRGWGRWAPCRGGRSPGVPKKDARLVAGNLDAGGGACRNGGALLQPAYVPKRLVGGKGDRQRLVQYGRAGRRERVHEACHRPLSL